ncbi:hypothetical protein PTNB73_04799 [Pyrenophora teres f. teres]|nr:hypothetical protein HRS9122_03467 [Pyrenophora teres f. teres]KAE8866705.1 hypothetical protein PTNB73_04799 [Pyrenophora teres f. teres]
MSEVTQLEVHDHGPFDVLDDSFDVQTPLLENMVVGVPPVFEGLTKQLDKIVEQPLLGPKAKFPAATFAFGRKDVSGRRKPQAIAHRGYKAKFPENTMGAFRGAIEVGADGLETDVHLTRDGVVVLSHDKDLKRCFGRDEKIIDCDYDFISTLRTLKEPHERMPRLADLLEYLAQPGLEDIWVLLDIKLDNDADDLMRLIGDTIRSVRALPSRPWQKRIVLGCWAAKYLPLCSRYLPGFPVSHIGFSTLIASYFFTVPNVSFNMAQAILMTPWGRLFIRKAQSDGRPVYAWTVNDEYDPKLFVQVRNSWHEGTKDGVPLMTWLDVLRMNFFCLIYTVLFQVMFGFQGKSLIKMKEEEAQ